MTLGVHLIRVEIVPLILGSIYKVYISTKELTFHFLTDRTQVNISKKGKAILTDSITKKLQIRRTRLEQVEERSIDKPFVIVVETLSGKKIELNVNKYDTIENIKQKVEQKEGIPPSMQKLIYSGEVMEGGKPNQKENEFFSLNICYWPYVS